MKKILISVLLVLFLLSCFCFSACTNENEKKETKTQTEQTAETNNDSIISVYNSYVKYAEENNQVPLSYELWLSMIKGADGVDGITPKLRINELTNCWQVSYDNGATWINLNVKATGADGEDGTNGKNGKDGKGIVSTTIDENGDLIIVYTDGSSVNVGKVQENNENPQGLEFCLNDDGTYSVGVGGARNLSNIVIPATYKGKAVTGIVYGGFYSCELSYINAKSITIPDSVTSIGEGAFYGCDLLTNIVIPDSVTKIGDYAFGDCYSLTSVTIGSGVTSIGRSAFNYCNKLIEVINKSGLNIEKGSEDNGYVGYYALNIKKSGESEVVKNGEYLFYTYDGINYLVGYTGNETKLSLPTNYNGQNYVINNGAFYNCDSLTSIVIPDGVTSIGSSAFSSCRSLTSIVIPDSETSIGSS
ncbi:MAG: leucine-rich repeat protein, partial [Clostridia bacterium]|nr:leucine-rich repeat protein [Clostridia bacterium]